ncbi:hypothetical protein V6N13_020134 [Hibiscus sabdariffa]
MMAAMASDSTKTAKITAKTRRSLNSTNIRGTKARYQAWFGNPPKCLPPGSRRASLGSLIHEGCPLAAARVSQAQERWWLKRRTMAAMASGSTKTTKITAKTHRSLNSTNIRGTKVAQQR